MKERRSFRLGVLMVLAAAAVLHAGEHGAFKKWADIPYAKVCSEQLLLDLYLPEHTQQRAPLIVYVHGGAWRAGDKGRMPLKRLVEKGFAVASVDYRLTPVAPFPAQVHDIKAAIRFLRAKQDGYGYDASRIALAGSSAGGHLAALTGVTNGHEQLEGHEGNYLSEPSHVQAIVSFYGASNLLTILKQSTPHGLSVRIPALQLLLGAQPDQRPDLAKLASPVFHVDEGDPPLLLIHGDQDPQMPINQSHELHGRYKSLGLPVRFEVVHGAAHGGERFYDPQRTSLVASFLEEHLRWE